LISSPALQRREFFHFTQKDIEAQEGQLKVTGGQWQRKDLNQGLTISEVCAFSRQEEVFLEEAQKGIADQQSRAGPAPSL